MSDSSSAVTIELSAAQVRRVLQRTAGGDLRALILGRARGRSQVRRLAKADPRLSSSLLTGLEVLSNLADGEAKTLTEIATETRITPSTTHRYLATLLAVGLIEQDPRTRQYRLPLR